MPEKKFTSKEYQIPNSIEKLRKLAYNCAVLLIEAFKINRANLHFLMIADQVKNSLFFHKIKENWICLDLEFVKNLPKKVDLHLYKKNELNEVLKTTVANFHKNELYFDSLTSELENLLFVDFKETIEAFLKSENINNSSEEIDDDFLVLFSQDEFLKEFELFSNNFELNKEEKLKLKKLIFGLNYLVEINSLRFDYKERIEDLVAFTLGREFELFNSEFAREKADELTKA